MALLTRDDLLQGLNELVDLLHAAGITGGVQIIGGAALALRYFDRSSTADIDARLQVVGDVTATVSEIGRRHDWGDDWLNDAGAKYIPGYGRNIEWETILERNGITIQVASAEALLAMKLRANRPGRDNNDIAQLMTLCDVASLEEAEELFEAYYPGDSLDPRAERMVQTIISVGLPHRAGRPLGSAEDSRGIERPPGVVT